MIQHHAYLPAAAQHAMNFPHSARRVGRVMQHAVGINDIETLVCERQAFTVRDRKVAALASLRKGGVVAINAIHLDRIPEFDYDHLLWGERQIRSVTNMTRSDARDFLDTASSIGLRPKATAFSLDQANEALLAIEKDSVDGAAVIVPGG